MHTIIWFENLRERGHLDIRKQPEKGWAGWIWLRMGTSGRLLWTHEPLGSI